MRMPKSIVSQTDYTWAELRTVQEHWFEKHCYNRTNQLHGNHWHCISSVGFSSSSFADCNNLSSGAREIPSILRSEENISYLSTNHWTVSLQVFWLPKTSYRMEENWKKIAGAHHSFKNTKQSSIYSMADMVLVIRRWKYKILALKALVVEKQSNKYDRIK